MILNRAKDFYENDKDKLRGQLRDKYKTLSEKEQNKKRKHGKNRNRKAKMSQYNNEEIIFLILILIVIHKVINKIVF